MRRLMSLRPSPAMVVAFIALLAALGTSAYAQLTIPRNSVGTAQLKRGAVTSAKVRNGSLLRRDFRRGQLPRGPRGFTGPQGPAGERGAAGPAGPAGPAGATNVTVHSATGTANAMGTGSATALCPANQRATGGGATLAPTGVGFVIESSPAPTAGTPTGWTVVIDLADPGEQFTAWVVCAAS